MSSCPTEDELSGLVMGLLTPDQIERVSAHVDGCPACEARLGALDQLSDPLMSGLRARAAGPEVDLQPGRVLGDYVLGEELGSGGMGKVFRATHARMRREVALKVVSRRGLRSQDAARRFAREVEVAAKLIHPNIAIAHDAREDEGIVYLILEYIPGTDLSRLVKEKGPLSIERAVDYVIQAAKGLAYAHARGIVHRDVKPANLMLDAEGTVKVLDLGLSRLRERAEVSSTPGGAAPAEEGSRAGEMTQAGDVLGTVDFVAPEQAQSPRDADHRADVYGLGCTLFYLLTAKSAFARGSNAATLAAHRSEPTPSLRQARPGVSARLEGVFARMVAKRPEDRFGSMNEVIAALRGCRAQALRRRWLAAAMAACLLLAAAGVWIWHSTRPGAQAGSTAATIQSEVTGRPFVPVHPFDAEMAIQHREVWREYTKVPETFTNSIGMKFTFIPPGEYPRWDGLPIRITRPFYMGVCEVTIGQFRQFSKATNYKTMAEKAGGIVDDGTGFKLAFGLDYEHPGSAVTDDHPALQLAYVDAAAMARWLSQKEGKNYRLPTVGQWVWAAQAGVPAPKVWNMGGDASDYGWNRSNSGGEAHAVGLLKPNPWGLYDVRGNAAEWCEDTRGLAVTPPKHGVLEDPVGYSQGGLRLLVGSTFMNEDNYTIPGNASSEMRYPTWGMRLMCEIDGAPSIAEGATEPTTRPDGATTSKSR